jgi:hypothetical protein
LELEILVVLVIQVPNMVVEAAVVQQVQVLTILVQLLLVDLVVSVFKFPQHSKIH